MIYFHSVYKPTGANIDVIHQKSGPQGCPPSIHLPYLNYNLGKKKRKTSSSMKIIAQACVILLGLMFDPTQGGRDDQQTHLRKAEDGHGVAHLETHLYF